MGIVRDWVEVTDCVDDNINGMKVIIDNMNKYIQSLNYADSFIDKKATGYTLNIEYSNGTMEYFIIENGEDEINRVFNIKRDTRLVARYSVKSDAFNKFTFSIILLAEDATKKLGLEEDESILEVFALYNASSDSYRDYINSYWWKEIRKDKLRDANYRCQLCGAKVKELHVHHNSYGNIAKEDMNDLIVLCKDCHAKFHDIEEVK